MHNILNNDQVICHAIHKNKVIKGSGAECFLVEGDKLKRLYQGIIHCFGWGQVWIAELKDKRLSIDADGSDASTLFFIQIADDHLPSRTYSTKGLSTPSISGATLSGMIGTTPPDLYDLIETAGAAGVIRRVFLTFNPIRNTPVIMEIRAFKQEQARKAKLGQNNIEDEQEYYNQRCIKYSFDIEVHRYHQIFKHFNYRHPDEADADGILLTNKHPIIRLECKSPMIESMVEYIDDNPKDQYCFKFNEDHMNKGRFNDNYDNDDNNENIGNAGFYSKFYNNDKAYEKTRMYLPLYLTMMMVQPIPVQPMDKGKEAGLYNNLNDGGSEVHEFHSVIMDLIIENTNSDNGFTVMSSKIAKKLGNKKKYKHLNNMFHLPLVAETMQHYGMLKIIAKDNQNQSTSKRGGSVKWSKKLQRIPLSSMTNINDDTKKAIIRYLRQNGIPLIKYTAAFSSNEYTKVCYWEALK